MNPQCARCGKIVYPTEKVNCLDKYWHKACFHCEICRMTLNMKTYKGYEKKPYCNAHYPKQQFTIVADTPENLRLKQQSELQSQAKYKEDFEKNRGRGFSIVTDTPELQRLKRTQEQISNIKYHEDFEKTKGKGFTSIPDDLVTERARKNTQYVSDAMYKGVHPHVVEMEKNRPGIMGEFKVWRTDPGSIFDFDPLEDNIQSRSLHLLSERAKRYSKQSQSTGVGSLSAGDERSEVTELNPNFSSNSENTLELSDEGAAVLPGAYQQMHSPHSPGYGYMHQSNVSSVRPQHSLPHQINMRMYRAMYDYNAADEDEVSFKDGDYIINVQAIDEGWMYGTVQRTGKTGMLPANYVQPLH
ncbi:nebulette isoform X1 [Narcine bancroftii]|uniref:nebulette isoform X1 n=1 Tax=Narcine bancroftii TaxID=1343680 RepID=UPI00383160D8